MKNILIIDDEASFTELVKLYLEKTGKFKVRTEYKGFHGLEIAKKFKPDLILLDILIGEESGLDILKKLKDDKTTQAIPVIMLSALSSEITKSKAVELGNQAYIEKPFLLEDLTKKIDSALGC